MDIEVKRMSSTAIEMLDQLSAVCKRFGVDYYAASQNQRDLLDSIALHEYQLRKAHEQGLKRADVLPFLGLKRTERSNEMPAQSFECCGQCSTKTTRLIRVGSFCFGGRYRARTGRLCAFQPANFTLSGVFFTWRV